MSRLLTCPECSARYRVPADAIGEDGKTVRCQKCEQSWFVPAEDMTPDALELADLEAAMVEEPERVVAPAPVGAVDMAAGRATPNAASLLRRAKADSRLSQRKTAIRRVWAVAILLIGLMLLGLLFARQAIVTKTPQAAGLYSAIGMKVRANGLDLAPVEARQVTLDGRDYLVVTGEVVNVSGQPRDLPIINMRLIGAGDQSLAAWSVDLGGGKLGPGARREYSTEFPNPPVDARRLEYGFED